MNLKLYFYNGGYSLSLIRVFFISYIEKSLCLLTKL